MLAESRNNGLNLQRKKVVDKNEEGVLNDELIKVFDQFFKNHNISDKHFGGTKASRNRTLSNIKKIEKSKLINKLYPKRTNYSTTIQETRQLNTGSFGSKMTSKPSVEVSTPEPEITTRRFSTPNLINLVPKRKVKPDDHISKTLKNNTYDEDFQIQFTDPMKNYSSYSEYSYESISSTNNSSINSEKDKTTNNSPTILPLTNQPILEYSLINEMKNKRDNQPIASEQNVSKFKHQFPYQYENSFNNISSSSTPMSVNVQSLKNIENSISHNNRQTRSRRKYRPTAFIRNLPVRLLPPPLSYTKYNDNVFGESNMKNTVVNARESYLNKINDIRSPPYKKGSRGNAYISNVLPRLRSPFRVVNSNAPRRRSRPQKRRRLTKTKVGSIPLKPPPSRYTKNNNYIFNDDKLSSNVYMTTPVPRFVIPSPLRNSDLETSSTKMLSNTPATLGGIRNTNSEISDNYRGSRRRNNHQQKQKTSNNNSYNRNNRNLPITNRKRNQIQRNKDRNSINNNNKQQQRLQNSFKMETDFKPMVDGISQPLPPPVIYKRSSTKLAESHSKLMNNLKYGVDGAPLDIWMPMHVEESK